MGLKYVCSHLTMFILELLNIVSYTGLASRNTLYMKLIILKWSISIQPYLTGFHFTDLLWVLDCGSWFTTPLWKGKVQLGSFNSTYCIPSKHLPLYVNSMTPQETLLICRLKDFQKDLNIQKSGQTTLSKLWRKHGKHCRTSKRATLCSLSQILLWNVLELHRRSCTYLMPFSERFWSFCNVVHLEYIKCWCGLKKKTKKNTCLCF